MKYRLMILTLLVFGVHFVSVAQQLTFECESPATYENVNRKESKGLTIPVIEGHVMIYAGENIPSGSNIKVVGACLAVFTEKEHRLVAQTISDENGNFTFTAISSGRYRLIVRHPMGIVNVANIPLRVAGQSSKGKSKSKKIIVYMVGNNFAENSFARLKQLR